MEAGNNEGLAFIATRTTIDFLFFLYLYSALFPLKLDKMNILKGILDGDHEFLHSWDIHFLPFISSLYDDILELDKKIHVDNPRLIEGPEVDALFKKYFE